MRNKAKKLKILSIFFLFVFLFLNSPANAQVSSGDVVLSITPKNPSANENITATLQSFVLSLDKALITWKVQNDVLATGIGKTKFIFKIDDFDSSVDLAVTIDTIDGKSLTKTITIRPATVDMLWEAYDSYSPPFYRGKTLVAPEGTYKIVAIPNINTGEGPANPSNLSYDWTADGNGMVGSSGWGKSFLIFQNSYLDKRNSVGVVVSDISKSVETEGSIVLTPTTPKIIFYKKDPLLGLVMERALTGDHEVSKEGETLVAMPYFFSPKNLDSTNISFDWSIGGERARAGTLKNQLTIKPEEGKSGATRIKVLIANTKTLFQELEKEIRVNF